MADEKAILALLGMCRRAGKLECGSRASREAIRCGKAYLVLSASDSPEGMIAGLRYDTETNGVGYIVLGSDKAQLGWAAGYAMLTTVAVTDKNFAAGIMKYAGADKSLKGANNAYDD